MNAYTMVVAIAAGIVSIAGAGAVIVKAFVRAVEAIVRPEFDALRQGHADLASRMQQSQSEQDEDFSSEVRSVKHRLEDLASSVSWLEAEMRPNHGSSLRDAVDRLERMLSEHVTAK